MSLFNKKWTTEDRNFIPNYEIFCDFAFFFFSPLFFCSLFQTFYFFPFPFLAGGISGTYGFSVSFLVLRKIIAVLAETSKDYISTNNKKTNSNRKTTRVYALNAN